MMLAILAVPALAINLGIEHQRVLDSLNHRQAKELDSPGVEELLNKGWSLAGRWAAEFLNGHPEPSPAALRRIFDGFAPPPHGVKSKYGNFLEYPDYCFSGGAVKIGDGVYAVEATYFRDNETSAFLVVARNGEGSFESVWNIKDIAAVHYPSRDEIGRWKHLVAPAYYNGPLVISKLMPARPARNGNPRFLVDAYESAHGGTALAQLSIWEWTGREAMPLLVKNYHFARGFQTFQFDGTNLRVKTKDQSIFHSCGMCPQPVAFWRIADEVQDLGRTLDQVELKWLGDLIERIHQGKSTADLAAPAVVALLKKRLQSNWGMYDVCRVLSRESFELTMDEGRLVFHHRLRDGRPYFTSLVIE